MFAKNCFRILKARPAVMQKAFKAPLVQMAAVRNFSSEANERAMQKLSEALDHEIKYE